MNYVFADTAYFVALLQPRDEFHDRAVEYQLNNRSMILTTQWVLVELANFCSRGRLRNEFFVLISELPQRAIVVPASDQWFSRGQRSFLNHQDKEWSLTDCISFEVMRERKIIAALTTDHHFEQAGFTALLK